LDLQGRLSVDHPSMDLVDRSSLVDRLSMDLVDRSSLVDRLSMDPVGHFSSVDHGVEFQRLLPLRLQT
jgi:hypothetical protein